MKNLTLLKEKDLRSINGGSEASLGFVKVVAYLCKKYARYAPSTSTLANCSAT